MQTKLKSPIIVLLLASIMSFRVMGLFMILPVLSAHSMSIPGATPTLIGLALGIYGLMQALLQAPLGLLSDKIGRKPIIASGLLLFAIGSIVAALAHQMLGLIVGRALQGMGAIGSSALALLADLTPDETRTQAMAWIGLSIGTAFSIAMITGPLLFAWGELSSIFWTTAGLAALSLLLLRLLPKSPRAALHHNDIEMRGNYITKTLKNKQLMRLNGGIFSLHLILTAVFIPIPILLTHTFQFSSSEQAASYCTIVIVSFLIMLPLITVAEKQRKMKPVFLTAIAVLCFVLCILFFFNTNLPTLFLALLFFFIAFNLLEASLPSLVSKFAPIASKGTAMGIYSTCQYFGLCLGGMVGGFLFTHFGASGVFAFCVFIALLWLATAIHIKAPPYLSTFIFSTPLKKGLTQRLLQCPGVGEANYSLEEQLLYIKADKRQTNKNKLRKCIEEVTL